MELHLLLTYLAAITLLTMTPGVDTLLIVRNAARGGWRDGAISSLGICSGLFVHAAVSAVGISMILLHSAWVFSLLKLLGAGYLVWLGVSNWRMVLRGGLPVGVAAAAGGGYVFDGARSFREGFLSNILNPKAAIFYMAFLPQFIDPARSALLQSLFLAGLHFLVAMVWQSVLSLLVDQAKLLLSRPVYSRAFGGLTGSVMILLGIGLALEDEYDAATIAQFLERRP